jgi:hypothetical protein
MVLRNSLQKRELVLNAGFSVRMPNNYVYMMDVDPERLKQEKLEAAEAAIDQICCAIAQRRSVATDKLALRFSGLKTALVSFVQQFRNTAP